MLSAILANTVYEVRSQTTTEIKDTTKNLKNASAIRANVSIDDAAIYIFKDYRSNLYTSAIWRPIYYNVGITFKERLYFGIGVAPFSIAQTLPTALFIEPRYCQKINKIKLYFPVAFGAAIGQGSESAYSGTYGHAGAGLSLPIVNRFCFNVSVIGMYMNYEYLHTVMSHGTIIFKGIVKKQESYLLIRFGIGF